MRSRIPFTALALAMFIFASCSKSSSTDYTTFVDPFIGTGGHGHTFPGATYPNGMVQLSPDTRIFDWDACSGYHYSDSIVNGFSHTHLSGTGCADYGDVLVMPVVGEVDIRKMPLGSQNTSYASPFSHKKEEAIPGYYSVMLDKYKVKAELTASQRAGFHKYTFPTSDKAGILIDLDYAIQGQITKELTLEVISDTEIVGYKKSAYWAPEQYIYFYAKTSKPFTSATFYRNDTIIADTKQVSGSGKVLLSFATKEDESIMLKVGISAVDADGARKNLEAEIPAWDFDKIKFGTRKAWNNFLAKVDVKTKNDSYKKTFYTALYHTAIAPNIFSDVDGRYRGMDKKIYTSKDKMFTVFSTWDTMRALHPLLSIIDPALNQNFIRSLIQKSKEGGILPMWELAANYTATMIGYNAVPIIVDAYMKGDRDFDVEEAYKAMLKTSSYDTTNIVASYAFKHALMPLSKKYKNERGYIPCDTEHENVAKGLEYAYDDWCILQVAKDRGDTANISRYDKLARNYKNYFDKTTGFMRGKDSNGNWRTPFNPNSSNHRSDDYCEGTAWQWLWFVPHDVDSLVQLLGGTDKFTAKLDQLFKTDSKIVGELISADISGLIGQYAHGNEPSHHIIHFYNYVNQPYKTQELIDSVLHSQYSDKVDGLAGNEDCGQMSAWYVLNSMGFYQVCPGKPVYSIGRPLFDRVTINLPNEKKFTIKTFNNKRENKYIRSMKLNGHKLEKPFFSHAELMAGGTLELIMSDKPKNGKE